MADSHVRIGKEMDAYLRRLKQHVESKGEKRASFPELTNFIARNWLPPIPLIRVHVQRRKKRGVLW